MQNEYNKMYEQNQRLQVSQKVGGNRYLIRN